MQRSALFFGVAAMNGPRNSTGLSLKIRLGLGAAALGAVTLLTTIIMYLGLNGVSERLDSAVASEIRMGRYATLSTQASTLLVVATEAVQTGLPMATRMERIEPVADQLRRTFGVLQSDVKVAVETAHDLGIDEQSRYGTQSLGLARMQALLDQTVRGLATQTGDATLLRAHIDSFASSFDPLLGQAVNTEVMFRNQILAGIGALRERLVLAALVIAGTAILAVALFYALLVRPQFRRLDALRGAAHRIGQEDFAVSLPVGQRDEIGLIADETNRMATALARRRDRVQAREQHLEATIAERTEALRSANTTLAQIDGDRRRFFADISHELRTPLTVILMEAQIGRKETPEADAAFATIEARAERLNKRIDDLLRLARSESGQLALECVSVPLPPLIATIAQEVRAELDNAGMTLTVMPFEHAVVMADPNWLRQVIVGLIRNTIRHAREGGKLQIKPASAGDLAGIALTDNGPGIAAADQIRVFDRFVQGNSATSGQGFGVGLALARWVVEEMGGRIALVSPPPPAETIGAGTGTKIAVCLPVARG